ncbi:MAG: TetR/AcrR family transcriptional regulator [Parachlamydiaceae bacterium]|nr:TetR/AcrR family transcriptional regulator [Parachlamydiaceae bacterium]
MNEDTTKTKILDAARQLFVENGFAGTSMGKIAKLAQVNHSLIYHHFVNKAGLWVAVKESIVKSVSKQGGALPSFTLPFKDFLTALMTRSIEFYKGSPDIAKLILWQRVEQSQKKPMGLPESEVAKEWLQALKHYQSVGEINKKHNPEFILTMIASLSSSAAMDPNVFVDSAEKETDYINFCVQVLVKGFFLSPE